MAMPRMSGDDFADVPTNRIPTAQPATPSPSAPPAPPAPGQERRAYQYRIMTPPPRRAGNSRPLAGRALPTPRPDGYQVPTPIPAPTSETVGPGLGAVMTFNTPTPPLLTTRGDGARQLQRLIRQITDILTTAGYAQSRPATPGAPGTVGLREGSPTLGFVCIPSVQQHEVEVNFYVPDAWMQDGHVVREERERILCDYKQTLAGAGITVLLYGDTNGILHLVAKPTYIPMPGGRHSPYSPH